MIKQRRGGGAAGGGSSQFVLPITNSNQHRNGVKPYYNMSSNKNPFRRMTGVGEDSRSVVRRVVFVLTILVLVIVAFFVVLKGNNATVTTQHDFNIIQQQQKHKKQQRRTQEEIEHQLDKKRAFDQAKLASRDNNIKNNEATAPSETIAPPAEYKQFSTLYKAMQLSSLTLLYFAASWCPESAPTTQQLVDMFDSTDMDKTLNFSLLTQGDLTQNNKADVAIVYVSSDDSLEDMMDYGLKEKWIKVPYEEETNDLDKQVLERTRLKRHFHTCAKIEAEPFKVQRTYGIPHLVVLTNTGDILTQHALEDLKDYYPNANSLIQHYQEMSNLATSLKDKFEDDLPPSAQHKGHKAVHDSVNPVIS